MISKLLLILITVSLSSALKAEPLKDTTKERKSLEMMLRETKSAFDSALSFFRSPKFDSLKTEIRQLAEDSKLLAKELRFSADSIAKMIEPYMDSIRPYIDSLTDLGEELDDSFSPRRFTLRGLPKDFRFEGNLNEFPHAWGFADSNSFKYFYDMPREMPNPYNRKETPKPTPKRLPPQVPNGKPFEFKGDPGEEYFQTPRSPGAPLPNYPGWKIQPLETGT